MERSTDLLAHNLGPSKQAREKSRALLPKEQVLWLDRVAPNHAMTQRRMREWLEEEKGLSSDDEDEWLLRAHMKLNRCLTEKIRPHPEGYRYAPVFDDIMEIYFKYLPQASVITKLKLYLGKIDFQLGRKHVASRFKTLTSIVKTGQVDFDQHWMVFVDLDQLMGFNLHTPAIDSVETVQRIEEWGLFQRTDRVKVIPDYYKRFRRHQESLLRELNYTKGRQYPAFDEWVADPDNWVTTGSSRGERVEIVAPGGEVMRSAAVKAVIATRHTSESFKQKLFDPLLKENAYPSIKTELGAKDRLIILMGLFMNTRLAYGLGWISSMAKEVKWTQLFYSGRSKLQWLLERGVRSEQRINLPIDDADYDQNIEKEEMQLSALIHSELMASFAPQQCMPEMKQLWELGNAQLWQTDVMVDNKRLFTWSTGMPSGIKTTAYFDTIINVTRQSMVAEMVNERYTDALLKSSILGQGDDADQSHRSWASVTLTLKIFEDLDFKPHKTKNFANTKTTEWLRKVITKDSENGYPGRGLAKVILRDPQSTPQMFTKAAFRTLAEQISSTGGRMDNVKKWRKMLVREIAARFSAVGWQYTLAQVEKFVMTPSAMGGLGVDSSLLLDGMALSVEIEPDHYSYGGELGMYTNKLEAMKRLTGKEGDEVTLKNRLAQQLVPKGRKTEMEWNKGLKPVKTVVLVSKNITASDYYHDFRFGRNYLSLDHDLFIHYCQEEKDIDSLFTVCEPSVKAFFQLVKRKATSRVFWMWIKGKLPSAVPIVLGISPILCSVLGKFFRERYYSFLFSRYSKVGFDKIECFGANAERHTFLAAKAMYKSFHFGT